MSADPIGARPAGIVVVGAGLAGPVAAIYMARQHGRVTVLERQSDPRSARSNAGRSLMVILSARGWRVLHELGLEDSVRRICVPLEGRCGHLPDGSRTVTPYSRKGDPIWAVERERLHHMLLNAAELEPGVELRFGVPVTQVELDTPAVIVEGADGTEHRLECNHLLGCDGVHSVIRRALVSRGARERVGVMELAYQEILLDLPTCDRNLMHYWPAGVALFGAFPLASSEQFAGSVFFRRLGPAPSYSAVTGPEELAEQFIETFPDLIKNIPDLSQQLAEKPISSVRLTWCDTWVHGGTAALIGDSCHAMAPFMGQGMNTAFEDVRILSECLENAGGNWTRGFAQYAERRQEEGDAIAEISLEHYRTMSRLPNATRDAEDALVHRLTHLIPERFVPLYEQCAFGEQSFSAAQVEDRALHSLARRILTQTSGQALTLTDDGLLAQFFASASTQESRTQ